MRVYVVTSGEYSAYHIEKVFTDREQAQMYANLNSDRYVEEYSTDDTNIDDINKYYAYIIYNYEKDRIESITEWDEYEEDYEMISQGYRAYFEFVVLVSGRLLVEIAEHGTQSEMLLQIAKDRFYRKLDEICKTRKMLLDELNARRKKSFITVEKPRFRKLEDMVPQEVQDKLDEMYRNGEKLPDILTLSKMVREYRKGKEKKE